MTYQELSKEQKDVIDTLQYYQLKGYMEDYHILLEEARKDPVLKQFIDGK